MTALKSGLTDGQSFHTQQSVNHDQHVPSGNLG